MARHLLFVALAGHGHVTPTLPLVEELVRRGHQVDYATAAEFAESVTGAGAHWVALPALEPFSPPAQVGPDLVAVWFRYFAAMRATCPVLREYCRTAPDRSPTPTGVTELGLGERLEADTLTPDALRQVVSRATADQQVRANLDRMRHAIHDSGGAQRGADVIKNYLS